MIKKILVLTGGGKKHLKPFLDFQKEFGVSITTESLSKINYFCDDSHSTVKVGKKDLKDFDVVYLRLVGKRLEIAAIVIDYCRQEKIRIVDRHYMDVSGMPISLSKGLEMRRLSEDEIPIPKTIFGSLGYLVRTAPKVFGEQFVIKATDGRRCDSVWSPRTKSELIELIKLLGELEKQGKRFLAQEFIKASQRNRVLVVSKKPIACITRGTRWRKRFLDKINGEFPEKISAVLSPVPKEDASLAVKAAEALGIEIAGVDILTEDKTGRKYILEVNSAPRWFSVTRDTRISVEREIVSYLASII